MLFNSYVFVVFFAVVCAAHLLLRKNHQNQNRLLLAASYLFYGWWDWRFLLLLGASTAVDFFLALKLEHSKEKSRKYFLAASIIFNIALLGFFKYFNFFSDSFHRVLLIFGFLPDAATLRVLLPVGISFYTFQEMSYVIDVYRRRIPACRNFRDFALFVSFFPQLVAGPIERSERLLPQIQNPRKNDWGRIDAGIFLILWGYFKKLVVADNLALIANPVFGNLAAYQGLDLGIGALAFGLQIYGDFSGYSDIGRGAAKLMGFDLMINFKLPYFARNPRDFWQRWHVSLSEWFRDYVYIPLGGNRRGRWLTNRNLFITMVLAGLWHGAAWHFVFWGVYHAVLLILYPTTKRGQAPRGLVPGGLAPFAVLGTFVLVTFGWVFFRCESMTQVGYFFTHLGFSKSAHTFHWGYELVYFAAPLFILEFIQYRKKDFLAVLKTPVWVRSLAYGFLMTWILILGVRESMEFIYFQF